jgi:hypothetical protein
MLEYQMAQTSHKLIRTRNGEHSIPSGDYSARLLNEELSSLPWKILQIQINDLET